MDFFYNLSDNLNIFVKTGQFKIILATFKWLFTIVTLLFIGLAIWLRTKAGFYTDLKLKYSYYLDRKKKEDAPTGPNTKELSDYWGHLAMRLNYQDEAQWKLAVIESDNFFDYVLKYFHYDGESLAERLQKVPAGVLSNIDDIWRAHRVRNNLVHDPNYRISYKQAEFVMNAYARALKDFKIL